MPQVNQLVGDDALLQVLKEHHATHQKQEAAQAVLLARIEDHLSALEGDEPLLDDSDGVLIEAADGALRVSS